MDQTYIVHHRDAHRRVYATVDTNCHVKYSISPKSLQWRHNGRDSVANHQPHGCLLNRSFRRRSKKTSKLRVTGLCAGNSQGTGEFPAQMASNAENASIWWRHHDMQTEVSLVLLLLYYEFVVDWCDLFNYKRQGSFTGAGTIIWLPNCVHNNWVYKY